MFSKQGNKYVVINVKEHKWLHYIMLNKFYYVDVIFSQNRIIILLKDKLLPDFYHRFFWSEENVVLNYFPTLDGVWVLVCPVI